MDSEWIEVGDRCFARRYDPYDITVGVVLGTNGALVLDTRTCLREGLEVQADLATLTSAPLRWVVNSHWHFDHTFGNAVFADLPIFGHETVPAMLASESGSRIGRLAEADRAEFVVQPPTETFSSVRSIDLGDRVVELVHPGRGHTDGDILVRVPDTDVVFVGDLVEESGPPMYGSDSYPMEWAPTLEIVTNLLTRSTAVVPGHGAVVDQDFVVVQRSDISDVAETIRELWSSGVPESEAPAAGSWPFPSEGLVSAVARGYAALRASDSGPEPGRTLPIVS